MRRAALAAACVAAGLSAAAQERAAPDPLPSERYSREDMARFRDCRVAAYYHLDGAEDPAATVPRSLAAALLAQINFVMSEALERTPPASISDAARSMAFTERFMMGFARAIAEGRERFGDLRRREETLLGCVDAVWGALSAEVDELLALRRRVLDRALGGAAER